MKTEEQYRAASEHILAQNNFARRCSVTGLAWAVCRCGACMLEFYGDSGVERGEQFAADVPDMTSAWTAKDAVDAVVRQLFDIRFGRFLKCRECGGSGYSRWRCSHCEAHGTMYFHRYTPAPR